MPALAAASFTAAAISSAWSRDSSAHGPAISTNGRSLAISISPMRTEWLCRVAAPSGMAGSGTGLAANVRRAGAQVSGAGVSERRAFATEYPNRTVTRKTGSALDMTTRLVLCLAVLLLAGACTTTGGGKDRSRHRTGPPKPPHHDAHKHDRLRNRMLRAAGVMNACGRRDDARRAIWNATVTNKWPKRHGRWSGRRIGKVVRLSTDTAIQRRADGNLRCRSFEVVRMAHRIDRTHSWLSFHYPHVRLPRPVVNRPAGGTQSRADRQPNRNRGDSSRSRDRSL